MKAKFSGKIAGTSKENTCALSVSDVCNIQQTLSLLACNRETDVDEIGWMSPLQGSKSPYIRNRAKILRDLNITEEEETNTYINSLTNCNTQFTPPKMSSNKEKKKLHFDTNMNVTIHADSDAFNQGGDKPVPYCRYQRSAIITDYLKKKQLVSSSFSDTTATAEKENNPTSKKTSSYGNWNYNMKMLVDEPQKITPKLTHTSVTSTAPRNDSTITQTTQSNISTTNMPVTNISTKHSQLPPEVLHRLRHADKEFEAELALKRQKAVSALQEALTQGSQAHIAELRKQLIIESEEIMTKWWKDVETELYKLVDSHFLSTSSITEAARTNTQQQSVLSQELCDAVNKLVIEKKNECKLQLQQELELMSKNQCDAHAVHDSVVTEQLRQEAERKDIIQANQNVEKGMKSFHTLLTAVQHNSIQHHLNKLMKTEEVKTAEELSKMSKQEQIAYHLNALQVMLQSAENAHSKQLEIECNLREIKNDLEKTIK